MSDIPELNQGVMDAVLALKAKLELLSHNSLQQYQYTL